MLYDILDEPLICKEIERQKNAHQKKVESFDLLFFGLRKEMHQPHFFHTEGTWVDSYRFNDVAGVFYSDPPKELSLDFSQSDHVIVEKIPEVPVIITACSPATSNYEIARTRQRIEDTKILTDANRNHPDLLVFMNNGQLVCGFKDREGKINRVVAHSYTDKPVLF